MTSLPLLAALALLCAALATGLCPPRRGHWRLRLPEAAALVALSLGLTSALPLWSEGPRPGRWSGSAGSACPRASTSSAWP